MASIFSGLNTAVSGLSAAQTAVSTTSHNISNAENKDFTRQRVNLETNPTVSIGNTTVGAGANVQSIARIHNEFVYSRYQQSSERVAYSSALDQNLKEISSFFPDMEGVGIKNDLDNYFRSWANLSTDPSSVAQKSVLVASAQNLVTGIKTSYDKLDSIQKHINSEIGTSVDEVNRIIKDISKLTGDILAVETNGDNANDLRDKRDALETTLTKLTGAEFVHGNESDTGGETSIYEAKGLYSAIIGGVAIVSGNTYHPLKLENKNSKDGSYTIKYQNRDGTFMDMSQIITKGKIGALLELRGTKFDESGSLINGLIPDFKNNFNSFANGLIVHTNSIYSQSANNYMRSNPLNNIQNSDNAVEKLGISSGTFNIVVYDKNGVESSKRVVSVDENTTFGNIMDQLQKSYDDNKDGSLLNDFSSQFKVSISNDRLIIESKNKDSGYTFGIEDGDTRFAGKLGLNRFFDGNDASNIIVNKELAQRSYKISGFKEPVDGNNSVADAMFKLQAENLTFSSKSRGAFQDTVFGVYNDFVTDIAGKSEAITLRKETIDVQYKSIEDQLNSISKVSIDNELASLIKYQTAYSASGKVVSTIDKMIDTLLGLKQ